MVRRIEGVIGGEIQREPERRERRINEGEKIQIERRTQSEMKDQEVERQRWSGLKRVCDKPTDINPKNSGPCHRPGYRTH